MPEPADLLRAWQDAIREVGGTAASLATGSAGPLLRPLQRQAELLERVLQRQLEFERELFARVTAPAQAALELVDQATTAMRGQAAAFRAAATSFGQAADLLEQQADLPRPHPPDGRRPGRGAPGGGRVAAGPRWRPAARRLIAPTSFASTDVRCLTTGPLAD